MKKIFTLCAIALLSLASCGKDEGPDLPPISSSSVLPKRVTYIEKSNDENDQDEDKSIKNITYNGNKINEITTSVGSRDVYTYTGDFITKITSLNVKNEIIETDDFSYDHNGKLISVVTISNNMNSEGELITTKNKDVYTHNSDGTIVQESYRFDLDGKEVKDDGSTIFTVSNGNVIKEVRTSGDQNNINVNIYEDEYDNKKSPFSNITGFDRLIFDAPTSRNNPLKSKYQHIYNNVVQSSSTHIYTNTYSTDGYLLFSSFVGDDYSGSESYEY
ncbi:MAG: hypothetical protein C4K58_01225 [Flavobacteriaceae bacterium]|nr:MAG: hypothetical protein C4K58_01225 [Flavobacteriaceae bacterium]